MQHLTPAQEKDEIIGTIAHALGAATRLPAPMIAFQPAPGREPTCQEIDTVVARLEHDPYMFAIDYLNLREQVRQQHEAVALHGGDLARLRGLIVELQQHAGLIPAVDRIESDAKAGH